MMQPHMATVRRGFRIPKTEGGRGFRLEPFVDLVIHGDSWIAAVWIGFG